MLINKCAFFFSCIINKHTQEWLSSRTTRKSNRARCQLVPQDRVVWIKFWPMSANNLPPNKSWLEQPQDGNIYWIHQISVIFVKTKFFIFHINRVTGFASAKVGRLAAFTIGGAIILLEVANEQGIIKIDWSRLYRKVDEAGDKVQETLTGEAPKWMDKVSFWFERLFFFQLFLFHKNTESLYLPLSKPVQCKPA